MVTHHLAGRVVRALGGITVCFLLCLTSKAADYNLDLVSDTWQQKYGYPTNTLANPAGIVGWWQMNSSTGSYKSVLNRVPSSFGGTMNYKGSYSAGLYNNGLNFTSTSRVTFAKHSKLNLKDGFTMSIWYKGSSATKTATLARWMGKSGNTTNIWSVTVTTNGLPSFLLQTGNSSIRLQPGVKVRDGKWHHIAATYQASITNASLYVDGALKSSGKMKYKTFIATNVHSFVLGLHPTSSSQPGFMLDEVRLYNIAQSRVNIANMPVTYYDMDGDSLHTLDEYALGTNPNNADTDGDGILDCNDSNPTSSSSTTTQVDTPNISPGGGSISSNTSCSISVSTTGATIYYTTDGSQATKSSKVYSGSFLVNPGVTVRSIAAKSGMTDSYEGFAFY
jgi:hypothetical protein